MLINHLVQQFQETSYIFYLNDNTNWSVLNQIKHKFNGELVIFIIEEITSKTSTHYINELLNFLDGPFSWEDCIIFATTNYPEFLPMNIIDRPSRFDMVIKIGNPSESVRKEYVIQLLGECQSTILKLTDGYSLAYVKEVCVKSLLSDDSLENAFHEVEEFQQFVRSRRKSKTEEYVT